MNDLLKENRMEGIEGTILAFRGSWDSGLAHLVVDGVHVPCHNSTTVKCLNSHFPNFIIEGHVYDENAIIGNSQNDCSTQKNKCSNIKQNIFLMR